MDPWKFSPLKVYHYTVLCIHYQEYRDKRHNVHTDVYLRQYIIINIVDPSGDGIHIQQCC